MVVSMVIPLAYAPVKPQAQTRAQRASNLSNHATHQRPVAWPPNCEPDVAMTSTFFMMGVLLRKFEHNVQFFRDSFASRLHLCRMHTRAPKSKKL